MPLSKFQQHIAQTAPQRSLSDAEFRAFLRSDIDNRFGEHIEGALLYGSRARGAHNDESDWDVLLVARPDVNILDLREKARDFAATIGHIHHRFVDLKVASLEHISDYASLLKNVAIEGVPL